MQPKRVASAALHAEINEYSALLRALKTRDLLDLTTQLTTPEITRRAEWDPSYTPPTPGHSDISHPANKSASPPKQSSSRDQWTRWPLLLPDIYIPEWSLEDELAVVGRRCLKAGQQQEDDQLASDDSYDSEDLDTDLPYWTEPLTECVKRFLKFIFALIAVQTPPRPASMLNRISVINWQCALNSLTAGVYNNSRPSGLSRENILPSAKMINNVTKRLEEIYGPASLGSLSNHPVVIDVQRHLGTLLPPKQNLSELLKKANQDLYKVPALPDVDLVSILRHQARRPEASPKRKRARSLPLDSDPESDYDPEKKRKLGKQIPARKSSRLKQ